MGRLAIITSIFLSIAAVAVASFVQDGTRDSEQIREWMHEMFVTMLADTGRPFKLLDGNFDDRLQKAIQHIEQLIR